MQFPDTEATRLTSTIMAKVREHLQPDEPGHPHHYNRAFEAVYDTLDSFFTSLSDGSRIGPVIMAPISAPTPQSGGRPVNVRGLDAFLNSFPPHKRRER